jgi:hypothetical protein
MADLGNQHRSSDRKEGEIRLQMQGSPRTNLPLTLRPYQPNWQRLDSPRVVNKAKTVIGGAHNGEKLHKLPDSEYLYQLLCCPTVVSL